MEEKKGPGKIPEKIPQQDNPNNPEDNIERRKAIDATLSYMMIPFLLGIPPVVGWYIGVGIDHYFGTSYAKYGVLVLGMVSGVREVYRIIKKYQDEDV